jgi:hypothetical protein
MNAIDKSKAAAPVVYYRIPKRIERARARHRAEVMFLRHVKRLQCADRTLRK